MLISSGYTELNRELHQRGNYGISGWKWADAVHDLARSVEARDLLDYGCGSGTLKSALLVKEPAYKVIEYDPAIPEKATKPLRADMVVCGDVLEHVEPDCLYSVLDDIRNIARSAVFLVIATRPAQKILSDGRNAHLIVERAEWWLPKIMDRWHIRFFRDTGGEFICIGSTK